MKKILLLAICCAFFAGCASSQEEKQTESPSTPVKTETVQKTAPAAPTAAPKNNIRENRTNVYQSTSRPKNEIKQTFPYDIELKDAAGKVANSSDVMTNGKPTVLIFWLTTCYPCKIEMAAIQKKFAQWQEETDFNLIAISTDFEKNADKFSAMVNEKGWPWDTYHDFNREFRHVMPGALNGLPQTFIIDQKGEIVYHKRKYSSGDEDILYNKVKQIAMK